MTCRLPGGVLGGAGVVRKVEIFTAKHGLLAFARFSNVSPRVSSGLTLKSCPGSERCAVKLRIGFWEAAGV